MREDNGSTNGLPRRLIYGRLRPQGGLHDAAPWEGARVEPHVSPTFSGDANSGDQRLHIGLAERLEVADVDQDGRTGRRDEAAFQGDERLDEIGIEDTDQTQGDGSRDGLDLGSVQRDLSSVQGSLPQSTLGR
jgi:hypothetical protein